MKTLLAHMEAMDTDTLGDLCELIGLERPDEEEAKEKTLRTLDRYVHHHPRRWLSRFMQSDALLLKELVQLGPEKHLEIEYADYPGVAEFYHFLETDNSSEDIQRVWITDEVYHLVAPVIDSVLQSESANGHYPLEQLMVGIINIYGVLPLRQFLRRVADAAVELGWNWDLAELLERSQFYYLSHIPYGDYDTDDDYVGSPAVADLPRLRNDRSRLLKRRVFRKFRAEEYLEAGQAMPFVNFGLETESGIKLCRMLRHIGYTEEELPYLAHDLWRLSQSDDGEDEIFAIVADMGDNIPSLSEFNRDLRIVSDYLDQLPRWALNGYTPAQKGEMRLHLEAMEAPRMPDLPAFHGSGPRASLRMPARVLPGSITIPHVGAYDLCPCGSGLQYRHCHGKNLS